MPRDLFQVLHADKVDHLELQQVLTRHFSSASQPGLREITYPGTGPTKTEFALRLQFSRKDQLTAIHEGTLLTPALEATIRAAVEDQLLKVAGKKVFRRVLFASAPLSGVWQYDDEFQILPVPSGAPRLDCILGNHPFLLEVKVGCSTDAGVTGLRVERCAREAELLLAGLVNSSIRRARRGWRFHWVLLPGEDHRVAHLQECYFSNQIPSSSDEFSLGAVAVRLVHPQELFGPSYDGLDLALPNNLAFLIRRYKDFGATQREEFQRACYWLQHATDVFLDSFSASFMAAVTAVEVLLEDRPYAECACCTQKMFAGKSLGASFVDFLDRYVPLDVLTSSGYRDIPSFRERLKQLYATRSMITHGTDLLGGDTANAGFLPRQNQQDGDLRTLVRIMHYAFAAWIAEQDTIGDTARATSRKPSWRERSCYFFAKRAGAIHNWLIRSGQRAEPRGVR